MCQRVSFSGDSGSGCPLSGEVVVRERKWSTQCCHAHPFALKQNILIGNRTLGFNNADEDCDIRSGETLEPDGRGG